jgi:hypothetical protein
MRRTDDVLVYFYIDDILYKAGSTIIGASVSWRIYSVLLTFVINAIIIQAVQAGSDNGKDDLND